LQTKKKDSDRKNYVINKIMTCSVREKILARVFKISNTIEKDKSNKVRKGELLGICLQMQNTASTN